MDNMDSFLTTIDEFVDDEEKIVTYKWLCQHLALQAGQAKTLLQTYVDGCRKRNNQVNVVYLIIGRDSKGMNVKIVREQDLEAAKEKLQKIFSVSIYSVQKAILPSSCVLYTSDYNENRDNLHEISRLGAIRYEGAVRLSKEEIKNRTAIKPPDGASESVSAPSTKSDKQQKSKTPQMKSNFFSKAKVSPATKVKEEPPSETKPPASRPIQSDDANKKVKKTTGMSGFLTKGKTDPFATKTKPTVKQEKKTVPEKVKEKPKKNVESAVDESAENDIREDDIPLEDDDFLTEKKVTKNKGKKTEEKKKLPEQKQEKKETQRNSAKSKKNTRNNSSELPAKKRRRIQEYISSSSESEEEIIEDTPPTPPPVTEPIKEDSPEKVVFTNGSSKNKRKKRVLKTKTSVDDDGCMVTEKYYEFESCSEDEEETVKEEKNLTNEKSKSLIGGAKEEKRKKFPDVSTAQPRKNKQASIMGFFKKK